jgi:hypothetical protein
MKKISLFLMAALALSVGAIAAPAPEPSVSLSQEPLVMRLSKDEFRIAFSINAERCGPSGCNGVIHYRIDWKTEDGTTRSEPKLVSYTVPPHANRAMTVDRQYLDTAEGAHVTDVIKVRVDKITCLDGEESRAPLASIGHD